MHKDILNVLFTVLLGRQSHEPILVDEDLHWVDYRRQQNVNAKVEFVVFPESRVLHILLHHVRGVFVDYFWGLVWLSSVPQSRVK